MVWEKASGVESSGRVPANDAKLAFRHEVLYTVVLCKFGGKYSFVDDNTL